MYNLSGKVALVTGAGGERGFGRAIAVRLAHEGADLIVNDVVQNPYSGSSKWHGLDSVVQSSPMSPTEHKLKVWCKTESSSSVTSTFW